MKHTRWCWIAAAACSFSLLALPLKAEIRVLAITSSADFSVGLLKRGGLASVFCIGLQHIPVLHVAEAMPLPITLEGVSVIVEGISAPILAVSNLAGGSYQQINIQIP